MAATLVESYSQDDQQNSKTTIVELRKLIDAKIRTGEAVDLENPQIARRMKNRWRSCGPDGSTATVGEYVTQNQKSGSKKSKKKAS